MSFLQRIAPKSIQYKLLGWFVFLSLAPLAANGWLSYQKSAENLKLAAGQRLQNFAEAAALLTDKNLWERYGDVQCFAGSPLALGTNDEIASAANFFTKAYAIYDLMVVADVNGVVLATNTEDLNGAPVDTKEIIGKSLKGLPWFDKVAAGQLKDGESEFTDLEEDAWVGAITKSRGLTLKFAAPVFDKNGKVVRVWVNWASWDRIVGAQMQAQRDTLKAQGITTVEAQVVAQDGTVLDDENHDQILKLNLTKLGLATTKKALSGDSGFETEINPVDHNVDVIGYASTKGVGPYKGCGWGVLVRQDLGEAMGAATQLGHFALAVAGFASLVVGTIATYVARKMSNPLKQTVNALEAVAHGDFSQRLDIRTNDELERVATALNTAAGASAKMLADVKANAEKDAIRAQEDQKAATDLRSNIHQMLQVVRAAGNGDYNQRIQAQGTDTIGELGRGLQQFVENKKLNEEREQQQAEREKAQAEHERLAQQELRNKVDQLLYVVEGAANGDLTREVTVTGSDPVGQLGKGLAKMLSDLKEMISQVVESASQFNESSRILAESAQNLAGGSQTQSAAVEEISASVVELARSINEVKNTAEQADHVATQTSQLAAEGGQAVRKSIEAMELIMASSNQVNENVQVISEIASQTNMLALNAAIEAARAGEHGLGFAVVADEVRKLAERAGNAAHEITTLIKESSTRISEGATLSSRTGEALEQIMQGVENTASKISEISAAMNAQASSADEVSRGIQNIGQVSEQTAAASDHLASSSEELGAQAAGLGALVSQFQIDSHGTSATTEWQSRGSGQVTQSRALAGSRG